MIDSESACPWGREDGAGEGRRAKFRHECLDESEDARPATICSGIQGCGGLESIISVRNPAVGVRLAVENSPEEVVEGLELVAAESGREERADVIEVRARR